MSAGRSPFVRTLAVIVGAAAVAFPAGYLSRGDGTAPAAPLAQAVSTSDRDVTALAAEVRAVRVRIDALAAEGRCRDASTNAQAKPAAPDAVAAPATPPPPEHAKILAGQEHARDESERIVDAAITAGVWTERDAARARSVAPFLGQEDREELMGRLIVAANRGALEMKTRDVF